MEGGGGQKQDGSHICAGKTKINKEELVERMGELVKREKSEEGRKERRKEGRTVGKQEERNEGKGEKTTEK